MKIELTRSHNGINYLIREAEIPGTLADYATRRLAGAVWQDEYTIDEDKLNAALPDGFLPAYPTRRVLFAVGDGLCGMGQTGYFGAYILTLIKPSAYGVRS